MAWYDEEVRWLWTGVALLGLGALAVRCDDDGPPALEAVEPSSGPNDRLVPIVIRARGLGPLVGVDVGCNGRTIANAHFDATLDTHLLGAVTWQSSGDLSAVVPIGLPPGEYDLHVMPPGGELLTLLRAYRVLGPGGLDAGTCEDLYASTQTFSGNGTQSSGNLALGPPDGNAGNLSGQWAANRASWTFGFDAPSLRGVVNAQLVLFLWVGSNYIDDRVVIEASNDAGQNWRTVVQYGEGSVNTLPTLRAQVGPFPVPNITMAPAAGQVQVRIRGDGAAGPSDSFALHVDAVDLQLCQ